MTECGRISEPMGSQSPDVIEWSRSLRSRSPSPSRQRLRSRSPSPSRLTITSARSVSNRQEEEKEQTESAYVSEIPNSNFKMFKKSASSTNPMRKSTGSLAATLNSKLKTTKSQELNNIETEYIKNLQQQIYFLELEANYLRDQAAKATEMHPKMTAEAEKMLGKLRAMQTEIDGLQLELKRKETNMTILNTEKEKIQERLRDEESSRSRDKRMLMDEIIQLKKERDLLEREIAQRDSQLSDVRNEVDKSATALRNAEVKIETLRDQMDARVEQHNLTQIALEEKRTELVSLETQLKEVEDKYYNTSIKIQDKVTNDLKDEIRLLRQKLKETEMSAEHDRYLKSKISEEGTQLARENAALNQEVVEMKKQLDREQAFREAHENRQTQSITELVQLKDKEKDARLELQHMEEQLRKEKEKSKILSEKVMKQESVSTTTELQLNTSKSRLIELENLHSSTENENTQLRKDKMLLVDHVSELQRKLDQKESEVTLMRAQIQTMEVRLRELEHVKSMESTIQSQKWEEFEKLAESMRTLSSTMKSQSGTSTTRLLQY